MCRRARARAFTRMCARAALSMIDCSLLRACLRALNGALYIVLSARAHTWHVRPRVTRAFCCSPTTTNICTFLTVGSTTEFCSLFVHPSHSQRTASRYTRKKEKLGRRPSFSSSAALISFVSRGRLFIAAVMPDWIAPIGPDGNFLAGGSVPIDAAHRGAVPHRGVWLHVLTLDGALLLVKRAQTMATCPGALSIVGEHHQRIEQDEDCALRALREELPGLQPLKRKKLLHLHLLRQRPRWFLFDYPLANAPDAVPRYDRCLISEYVLRLAINSTEALEMLSAGRAREREHETSHVQFEPLGSFARKLVQTPQAFCAPELLPGCLLDSLADLCVWLRTSREQMLPPGCNESPLLGRGSDAIAAGHAGRGASRGGGGGSSSGGTQTARGGVMPELLDLHRVVRAAQWATTPPASSPARRWHRKRSTSEEGVCEMPDWKYGCRQCDARCRAEAGGWAADCKQVKDACRTLYDPAIGEAGTGINAGRAEREYEDIRNGKFTGLPSSRKWASSIKGKDWTPANGYGAVSKRQAARARYRRCPS